MPEERAPMSLFEALGLPFGRGPQQSQQSQQMRMQEARGGPFGGFGLGERPVSRPEPIAIQVEMEDGESLEDAINDAMLIDQVVRMITGAKGSLVYTTKSPPLLPPHHLPPHLPLSPFHLNPPLPPRSHPPAASRLACSAHASRSRIDFVGMDV
jgi:hypothetical protein